MNPKKKGGKRKRYYPSPKPRVSIKNNKAVKAQPGPDKTREEKARRALYKTHADTILNPHSKCRGGVGSSDRESYLFCAFPARFRVVAAWSACT